MLSISYFVLFDWSLLSGAANGLIAVHDLQAVPTAAEIIQRTYPAVCRTEADNTCRHRGSVETVQWYPVDTGMFVSSGNDTYVKVWDTNVLRVSSLYVLNYRHPVPFLVLLVEGRLFSILIVWATLKLFASILNVPVALLRAKLQASYSRAFLHYWILWKWVTSKDLI